MFTCQPFNELSPLILYKIMKARSEVFVVEQNCVYLDADDKDLKAHHLVLWRDEQVAGYTRLLPPGVSYDAMSIGRVLTTSQFRNQGLGKTLMDESIQQCRIVFGTGNITIGAQLYLKAFYESFGFQQEAEVYLEDNIPHIQMTLIS
ncbi:MAG TPA: GNAT family N-acetyltransferase [Flavitalea sp.]|nr:GNAT family N-acetyltransferase [Flavitalea sp.]